MPGPSGRIDAAVRKARPGTIRSSPCRGRLVPKAFITGAEWDELATTRRAVADSTATARGFNTGTLLQSGEVLVASLRPGVMIKAEDHRAPEEAGDRYESGHDQQRNPVADPDPTTVWMATQFAQQ
jgi:hypothetical protein